MSSRDPRDDDLEERLDELEDVLSELRADLRETERDRRGPPRPPRLSELLRFTEQYTIPTLIALLETTIKSLELLQGTLRLADPGRSVAQGAEGAGDRLADVRDGATAGLSRSLAELRNALSEADLPEEAASRSIVADARDLTAEIESRIEEGRREADAARSRRVGDGRTDRNSDDRRRRDRDDAVDTDPVRIDVTDPGADDADGSTAETDADDADAPPEVDVESELESIKRAIDDGEKDGGKAVGGEGGDDEATDGEEPGDGAADGEEPGDDGSAHGEGGNGTEDDGQGR